VGILVRVQMGNDEVSPLLRKPPPPEGRPAILLPSRRILMPGATRTLHLYDQNLLCALEKALETDATLALVSYDVESRVFVPGPGTLASIIHVEHATRMNFRNETSASKMVTITGLSPFRVNSITQFEPYVVADLKELKPEDTPAPSESQCESIRSLCSEVASLRLDLDLGILEAAADGTPDDTEANLPGVSSSAPGSRVMLALTAAQHVEPECRAAALVLSGEELGEYVSSELLKARSKLAAMKALSGLG